MRNTEFVYEALLRHPEAGVPPGWATTGDAGGRNIRLFRREENGSLWALLLRREVEDPRHPDLVLTGSSIQWAEIVVLDADYRELYRDPRQLQLALGIELSGSLSAWVRSACLIAYND